jgi:ATP-dependent helicase Lhr and Lhr-like helicase
MPRRRLPRGSPLRLFHPRVAEWFVDSVGAPSEPQRQGWPVIGRGDHTLVLAPTGTGKTFAAFLWELNALISEGLESPLANAVHLLYVSPLKALNNDIQRNLEGPLAELKERFEGAGEPFPDIRVAVRTGDTPASARARMLRKTPHILITTPESLHILLTSVRGRGIFSSLRAVIIDEIHAVAGSKRGAHLALTLERLEKLVPGRFQRIGLSATQRPLEEIARFLGGMQPVGDDGTVEPRPVTVVDCGLLKKMEVTVTSPVADLGEVGGTIWTSVAPLVLRHIRESRTTLVFVNNRAQAEKIAARVNALAEEEVALPYHGSLSRERRLMLERALKAGELRALVSTSSLELGIDIGSVDLVLQLQSPKRVAAGLQRVGRAGHNLAAVSRGVFVPTFRDDAAELLAVVAGMRDGDVEPTMVVQNALDVLAQVVVAAAASEEDLTSAELFSLVRQAYPYHALTRDAFDEVLGMLSGKYPADVAAALDARISWNRATDTLQASRGSRIVSVTSGGTIPDRGLYTVILPDRTRLGELDEEFVHETRIGDVFQLGSSTWRVGAIEHDRVIVTPAPGAPARMPFWHGEFMSRSSHLTPRLGELRRELAAAETEGDVTAIAERYGCDLATAESLAGYVREQRAATGTVPDDREVVVEQFRDETGSLRVVIHAPFGGRVNAPWGMALAQRVRESLSQRGAGDPTFEVQLVTTDDGMMLRLPPTTGLLPLDVLLGLLPDEAERRVLDEVGSSALFGARFRMNAARALLLPRGNPRRRMPLWLQRLKSLDLLEAVREFPSFPILVETYRDVLQDAFDMAALRRVLESLARGSISVSSVETRVASPFASSLQFGFVMDWMYADDAPRAEKRAAMLSLDRGLLDDLLGNAGADEETLRALAALVARRNGTAPGRRARDADELALLLDRAGDLERAELEERVATLDEGRRGDPLAELVESARAVEMEIPTASGTASRWVLVENLPRYASAFGSDPGVAALQPEAARREILTRLIARSGPVSMAEIRARYELDTKWLERRLQEMTSAGRLVRGAFGDVAGVHRWCSRRLLEEARRRELAAARREIRPIDLTSFTLFLQRWQRLDPSARGDGAAGTSAAVRQLYGFSGRSEGWLRDYLPGRVERVDVGALSRMAAEGELVWVGGGRLDEPSGTMRLTTVRFVRRGSGSTWLLDGGSPALSDRATALVAALERWGASFFNDLQAASGLGLHALRDALSELAAAGLVTNDSIESLAELTRWRPVLPTRTGAAPDPTRWLPEDFVARRPVVQRRASIRRLPKWKRPELEGERPWSGRWALVQHPGILGPPAGGEEWEAEGARVVVAQWLERYGVVTRDWWRRERPNIPWRSIYHELKRMEFRGEVRRGYFVEGLAGAQFALPGAVDALRAAREESAGGGTEVAPGGESSAGHVVMAVSDPANPFNLPLPDGVARDPLSRPRGRGALLVTRLGHVVLAVEGRGRAIRVRAESSPDDVERAARALALHLQRSAERGERRRDLNVESIDGAPALESARADSFIRAGYARTTRGLRLYRRPG